MKLVILLAFFDETPDFLYDCIGSLRLIGADHVVCSDGAYSLWPNPAASSKAECHDAIRDAASTTGIPTTIYVPSRPWRQNEIEKRTHLFRLGDQHKADFFAVIDADERILRAPPDVKDRLAATDRDVAHILSLEHPARAWRSEFEGAEHPQIEQGRHTKPRNFFFRAFRSIEVRGAHCNYFVGSRNLWGDQPPPPLRMMDVLLDHRNQQRDAERRLAALRYYDVRDRTRSEPDHPVVEKDRVAPEIVKAMGWA